MNSKSIALATLRVLSVFFIVEGISAVPFLWNSDFDMVGNASALITVAGISAVLLPLVLGITLWLVGPFIADRIIGKEKTESEYESFTLSSAQVIALVTLGVYLISTSIPALLGLFARWNEIEHQHELHTHIHEFLIADVFRILVGLVLILGANYFTKLFMRLRGFGLSSVRDQ